MTNEEQLQDLKQYIDARVVTKEDLSAAEERLNERSGATEARLNRRVDVVDQKLDTITEAIGETVQANDDRLEDRLRRLERRTA